MKEKSKSEQQKAILLPRVKMKQYSNKFNKIKSWYICISCHRAFPDVEKLRAHRLTEHFSKSDSALILDAKDLKPVVKLSQCQLREPKTVPRCTRTRLSNDQVTTTHSADTETDPVAGHKHIPKPPRIPTLATSELRNNEKKPTPASVSHRHRNTAPNRKSTRMSEGLAHPTSPSKRNDYRRRSMDPIELGCPQLQQDQADALMQPICPGPDGTNKPAMSNNVKIKVEGYTLPMTDRTSFLDNQYETQYLQTGPMILEHDSDDDKMNENPNNLVNLLDQHIDQLTNEIGQVLKTLSLTAEALNEVRDVQSPDPTVQGSTTSGVAKAAASHEQCSSHEGSGISGTLASLKQVSTTKKIRRNRDLVFSDDEEYEPSRKFGKICPKFLTQRLRTRRNLHQ